MAENNMQIRSYKAGDEIKILKLFKQVFNINRSLSLWNWQFKNNTQGPGWVMVAEKKGEIVGQVAIRHNYLNFLGKRILAGQSCDIMVRRDYQGKGLFTKLAKQTYSVASKNCLKAVFGFPNRSAYPGYMQKLGRHRVAILKYYYYRIGFRKIFGHNIDRILKHVYGMPSLFMFLLEKKVHKNIRIKVSSVLDVGISDLLNDYLNQQVLSIWKDLAYMQWRYAEHPTYNYQFHLLYQFDRLDGLAVVRNTGISIVICDFLHRSMDVSYSILLLRHIVNYYRNSPAQKIEFYGWDNGFFDSVFQRCGFQIQPSNFKFTAQVLNNGEGGNKERFEKMFIIPQNWTITYGDTDVI